MPGRFVVIGVGSEFRRDDGVALAVLARLAGRVPAGTELVASDGEPVALVEAWDGAGRAVVIDAATGMDGGAGSLRRILVAAGSALPTLPEPARASWHDAGLTTAIALSRALNRLPATLIVHLVQVADTGFGQHLSPPVAASVGPLADAVLADLAR